MPEPFDMRLLCLDGISELPSLVSRCPDVECLAFREGEYLMREGEESQDLFIVVEGAYVVERLPDVPGAQPSLLATVMVDAAGPSFVGEMAYFGSQRRSASVRSSGRTLALCLKPHHIEAIVEHFPGLLKIIFRQLAERLVETNCTLKELQARFALAPERRMGSAGERLFSAGDPADQLIQLLMGEIRIEDGDGSRILRPDDLSHGLLEPGPFLRGRPHGVSATVENTAFLLVVDAARREAVVRSYPGLALELLAEH